MKLINKTTQQPVAIGDEVQDFKGSQARLLVANPPHKPSSEGKVQVRWHWDGQVSHELYCSVFNLEWIEREDRQDNQ